MYWKFTIFLVVLEFNFSCTCLLSVSKTLKDYSIDFDLLRVSLDFSTSNLSYIIREILNHKRYISATKNISQQLGSDNSCWWWFKEIRGSETQPSWYGYPISHDFCPGFFGIWWLALDHDLVVLGLCHGMRCKKLWTSRNGEGGKFHQFRDPGIFLATPNMWIQTKTVFFWDISDKKTIYAPEKNSEDVMLSNLIFWNMFQFVDIDARNSQQLFFFWGGHPERRRSCSWFVGSQFLGSILERYCFSWAVSCCTPCNIIDFLAVFCRIFWKHHN